MAKAPKNKQGRQAAAAGGGKGGGGRRVLILLIGIVLVAVFFDSVIVLSAGMIPTAVAFLIDRNPRKHTARTVSWMNLAGCLIVLLDLWAGGGGSVDKALEILAVPLNWLIMFGAAAVGWGIFYAVPPVVAGYLSLSNEMKLRELAKTQKRLEREWGIEVRDAAPLRDLEGVEEELAASQEREAQGASGAAAPEASAAGEAGEAADEDGDDLGDLSDTPAGRTVGDRASSR